MLAKPASHLGTVVVCMDIYLANIIAGHGTIEMLLKSTRFYQHVKHFVNIAMPPMLLLLQ